MLRLDQKNDRWMKCISTQGNIRGVALQATGLVQKMAELHQLKGSAIQGFGEAVIGALLIASYCKQGQRINLNIQGSGWFKQALIDAYPEGAVRGYVIQQPTQNEGVAPEDEFGPWGEGFLSVLRSQDERSEKGNQPYIGTVPLLTGHLAKDLSFYWAQSEQVPSAVGLSVIMDGDRVESAGGFLVQALPGASPLEVRAIEQHIHEIQSLPELLRREPPLIHLLSQIFQNSPFMIVEEKNLIFRCDCSWERVQKALILIGPKELNSILVEEKVATVKCDFCGTEYNVDGPALEDLIRQASTHHDPQSKEK